MFQEELLIMFLLIYPILKFLFSKMGPFLEKCFHLNFVRKVKCSCIDKFFNGSYTINVYFCPTEIKGFSSLKSLTEQCGNRLNHLQNQSSFSHYYQDVTNSLPQRICLRYNQILRSCKTFVLYEGSNHWITFRYAG